MSEKSFNGWTIFWVMAFLVSIGYAEIWSRSDPDAEAVLEARVEELVTELGDETAKYNHAKATVKRLTKEASEAVTSCQAENDAIRTEVEGGCLTHVVDIEGQLEICTDASGEWERKYHTWRAESAEHKRLADVWQNFAHEASRPLEQCPGLAGDGSHPRDGAARG